MKNNPARRSGILLLDKPTGITSARAVAVVRRALGKPKVGHLGTLDPFASGLLPLCIGEATKIAPFLNTADKAYRGVIQLGLRTDTLDGTGEVLERATDIPDASGIDLKALAARFTGTLEQVPPAFSAIKKDGVPMYKLAREGRAPELEPRQVCIHRLVLRSLGPDRIMFDMTCSKGTYVRSLARDLGDAVGCGATLVELVRSAFGDFALESAISLQDVEQGGDPPMIGLAEAVAHLPELSVDAATAADLRQGRRHALAGLDPPRHQGELRRILASAEDLVAVVRAEAGEWDFERVFAATP